MRLRVGERIVEFDEEPVALSPGGHSAVAAVARSGAKELHLRTCTHAAARRPA
jgi:hypothetical protein